MAKTIVLLAILNIYFPLGWTNPSFVPEPLSFHDSVAECKAAMAEKDLELRNRAMYDAKAILLLTCIESKGDDTKSITTRLWP